MADEIVKVIKIEAQGSEQSVKQLRQEISTLRDALLNTEKGSDEYNATVEKLTNTQKKLNDVMSAGKTNFSGRKQELRALKAELENLEVGTAEYNATFQKAAQITHQLQEQQEMLKYSAADVGTQLSNVVSIGSSMAAGFNAVNAVMALTGSKSEELEKTMVKLQAGIALVQGMQGLEGMQKRIGGLVNGLTEMIFKTTETTTAVGAETVAVQANATAQEANTVATAGATVATNAFKKALVATGIGAIIVLLGTLIAHWDEFKEMVGLSNEKLDQFRDFMDKARVVISGVANALANILLVPIKNTITAISTLGTVIADVFQGKFRQAAIDAKEGISKIIETTKDGFNVIENYQEGAARTEAKIQEEKTRKALENSTRELEEVIKDNEAKYGSDWKYTEEGKKLYDQYYAQKLKLAEKDKQEYREVNREKMAYDREYAEHNKKVKADTVKTTQDAADKELAEIERIKKRAEDAAKDELQLLTEKFNEELALFEKYNIDTTALTEEYEAKKAAIEEKRRQAEEEANRQALALKERELEQIEQIQKRAEDSQKTELQLLEEKYETEKALYEKYQIDITDLTIEYEAKRKEIEDRIAQEKAEKAKADEQAAKDAINAQIDMYRHLAEAIGEIFGSIGDILEEDIKNKVKNGQLTQEEGEKQFKAVKAFQIAQATIQTISGAIAAYMSCQQTYPQPAGTIIGAVQAAAVTAAGIAQIAKIKNTQLNGGGGSTVSTMTASAVQTEPEQYTPQMYQNPTGESEITRLADNIKAQKVYVVESEISEAQRRSKVRVTESTW